MSPVEIQELGTVEVAVQPVEVPITIGTEPVDVVIAGAAAIGPPGTVGPFHEGHTFAVLGDLAVLFTLPSFFVPKAPNQTVKLRGLWTRLAFGTVMFQPLVNGASVGAPVAVSTVKKFTDLGGVALIDGAEISASLSGHTGPPNTLSATVVLEWSVP